MLLLLIGLASTGFGWYCLVQPFLKLRHHFFPPDAFLMNGTRLGNIAVHVAPAFPACVVGFLVANYCVFLMRQKLETRNIEQRRYGKANAAFSWVALVVSFTVAIPLAALGATSYFYLTPTAIVYRPSIFEGQRTYDWSDLAGIETACWYSKGRQESYTLRMRDGTGVSVLESYGDFRGAYPVMAAALRGHAYTFDRHAITPRCEASLSSTWRVLLTTPPSVSAGIQE